MRQIGLKWKVLKMERQTQIKLELAGREIILVGTAHVSKASIEEVKRAIDEQKPDVLAVELDENRRENMENPEIWKNMDIIKVLKNGQGFLLLANLVLSAYQKKMGDNSGINPGEEMIAAINRAKEMNIESVMVDRPISITLRRAWSKNSFSGKMKLLGILFSSTFSNDDVSPDEIENLKKVSEMDSMMSGLSSYLPAVKEVLIDERDKFLASKIWNCRGDRVLAVLGAGHLVGVQKHIERIAAEEEETDVSEIETVPEKSKVAKAVGWLIPSLIIALIAAGFVIGGIEKGTELLGSWVLWNGILAAIGALAGGAHIITIIASAIGAPLTSLCPLVGIGIVAAIVQAVVKKPSVSDMENLQADASSLKGFYKNRILRILLIFFLSSIGSSIGTFAGSVGIITFFSNLFGR